MKIEKSNQNLEIYPSLCSKTIFPGIPHSTRSATLSTFPSRPPTRTSHCRWRARTRTWTRDSKKGFEGRWGTQTLDPSSTSRTRPTTSSTNRRRSLTTSTSCRNSGNFISIKTSIRFFTFTYLLNFLLRRMKQNDLPIYLLNFKVCYLRNQKTVNNSNKVAFFYD